MPAKKHSAPSAAELEALTPEKLDETTARKLQTLYAESKAPHVRSLCLRLLYDKPPSFLEGCLEDFFDQAYRKERHLDLRVLALRGLAQFRGEQALADLLAKFNESLRKRALSTPHNYQEYECMLGKNALPYLTGRYGYACLQQTLAIVQANYDAMPEAFKGHFSIDEQGRPIALRSAGESHRILAEFFAKEALR